MNPSDPLLYFAYGSNMLSRRLQARVPSARAVGIGRLHGHVLRWHMPSMDGSAKCDAAHTGLEEDHVWGVLFEFERHERHHLDHAESLGVAYDAALVDIVTATARLQAMTYRALRVGPAAEPYHWYREFVVRGAEEHGLPADYRRGLEAVLATADADAERSALNESIYAPPGPPACR